MVSQKQNQSGFAAVEILIAAFILMIIFPAVILLVLGSQKASVDTRAAHEAELLNEKLLAEGRAATLANFTTNVDADSVVDGFYNTSRKQYYVSDCVKKITSRVDWTLEGRALYIENITHVTNPAVAFAQGSQCNIPPGPPSGDDGPWEGCFLAGTANLQGSGDHDAYDLDVIGINGTKYIFIVTHPHNASQSPEDLWVYDIDDNTNPVFVNKLDVNGDGNIGLNTLAVAQDSDTGLYYAYLGVDDNENQFIVVEVTNPTTFGTPVVLNVLGVTNNVHVKDIRFFGGFAYLAIGSTIRVFNVANPTAPTGPTTITLSGTVNKLSVTNDYIYAATADNNAEIVRINRSNFTQRLSYNAPGNADGTSITANGTTVYLGRVAGHGPDFIVVESGVGAFTLKGTNDINHQNNTEIVNLLVVDRFAFVASTDSNQEFEVYDVTDPDNIVKKCLNPSVNPPNIGFGLDYFDNYVYLAMRSNEELQVYTDHP